MTTGRINQVATFELALLNVTHTQTFVKQNIRYWQLKCKMPTVTPLITKHRHRSIQDQTASTPNNQTCNQTKLQQQLHTKSTENQNLLILLRVQRPS